MSVLTRPGVGDRITQPNYPRRRIVANGRQRPNDASDRTTRPSRFTPPGEDFRYETRKGLYFITTGAENLQLSEQIVRASGNCATAWAFSFVVPARSRRRFQTHRR